MQKQAVKQRPLIQYVSLTLLSFFLSVVTAVLYITIAGSNVYTVISVLCAAVLCLLPAVCAKIYCILRRLRKKRELVLLCFVGFVLSLGVSLSCYVGHDYEMSVYRYMKQTDADEYYFAGYESFLEDYGSTEDFMKQMKSAPASIVLESMSEEKISRLTADELKTINNESLWDYCGFDDILGSTADEVEASMKAASEMTTYDFTFKYRGLRAKTPGYLLTHPKLLMSEVKSMAVSPGQHSAHIATLILLFIGQLFAHWMIQLHFEITENKEIIYVKRQKNNKKEVSA